MNAMSVLTSRPWIWSCFATPAGLIITKLFKRGAGAQGL
jgi:ribose transport system permease protein